MATRKSTKIELVCEVCKEKFSVYPSRFARGNTKFCSRKCLDVSPKKSTKIEIACETCERKFSVFPNRLAKYNARFCSYKCHYESRKTPLIDRFKKLIGDPEESGCRFWNGKIERTGYGSVWCPRRKKAISAHRASWELNVGEIPDKMNVLHKCDNRKCVNHEHLFLGTHKDNMDDMVRKGRQAKNSGEKCGHAKLTNEQVLKIRWRYSHNLNNQKELAEYFNISRHNVSLIINRKTWKNI